MVNEPSGFEPLMLYCNMNEYCVYLQLYIEHCNYFIYNDEYFCHFMILCLTSLNTGTLYVQSIAL